MSVAAPCGAVVSAVKIAAVTSDAVLAPQMAAPLEWQQVEARTQWCGDIAADIG
jgi:hypothetical protein